MAKYFTNNIRIYNRRQLVLKTSVSEHALDIIELRRWLSEGEILVDDRVLCNWIPTNIFQYQENYKIDIKDVDPRDIRLKVGDEIVVVVFGLDTELFALYELVQDLSTPDISMNLTIACNKCDSNFSLELTDTNKNKPIIGYCGSCNHPVINPAIDISMVD